jgi:hypothetical protein
LLSEQDGEGALGKSSSGSAGDVLQGLEINLGAGALFPEGASSNDFAPLGGGVSDFLEFVRGELARRYGLSCLVRMRINAYAFCLPLYLTVLCRTKLFLASWQRSGREIIEKKEKTA